MIFFIGDQFSHARTARTVMQSVHLPWQYRIAATFHSTRAEASSSSDNIISAASSSLPSRNSSTPACHVDMVYKHIIPGALELLWAYIAVVAVRDGRSTHATKEVATFHLPLLRQQDGSRGVGRGRGGAACQCTLHSRCCRHPPAPGCVTYAPNGCVMKRCELNQHFHLARLQLNVLNARTEENN